MIKKLLPVIFICTALIITGGCKPDSKSGEQPEAGSESKYSDVIAYLNNYYDANEEYYTNLGKASSPKDVKGAIETMAGILPGLVNTSKALIAKYPEIKGINAGKHPKELDDVYKRQANMMKMMQESTPNMQKHFSDVSVVKSYQKMAALLPQLKLK